MSFPEAAVVFCVHCNHVTMSGDMPTQVCDQRASLLRSEDMEQGVHGAMQQVQRWEGSTCPRVLIMCAVVQICLGIDSSLQAAFAVPGGSVPGKARTMRLAEGLSNAPQAWEPECTRLYKQKCVPCILLCRS